MYTMPGEYLDHELLVERAALYDIVFFDMDGVLSDFDAGYLRLHGYDDSSIEDMRLEGEALGLTASQHYCAIHGISKKEFWETIKQSGTKFWEDLPIMTNGVSLWHELQNQKCQTVILTSPQHEPTSASGKMMWLRNNLGIAVEGDKRFVITSFKHLLSQPGRLLIDDTEDKVEKFRAKGGHAWLWPEDARAISQLKPIRRL